MSLANAMENVLVVEQQGQQEEEEGVKRPKLDDGQVKYVDVYRQKPLKLSVKVLVPVDQHPKVRDCAFIVASWVAAK